MKETEYKISKEIKVSDKMQTGYSYELTEKIGREASDYKSSGFHFEMTPQEILNSGVFEGKYLNDCWQEFPEEWFYSSKEKRSSKANIELNQFKVKSRLSLQEWERKNWIIGDDPRGWFQWFCRYYIGRRTNYDQKQIDRWKSFKRHLGQIKKNCREGDCECRPRQRQGLLQWAYNPFI